MTTTSTQYARIGIAVAIVLALGGLAGCSSPAAQQSSTTKPAASSTTKPSTISSDTGTAKGAAAVALSTLSTAAPDGVIMLAETLGGSSPASSPAWQFMIASPKENSVYSVLVADGKGKFQPVGVVSFSPAQWEQVPRLTEWKLDSDQARLNAIKAYPKGLHENYAMALLAYVPVSGSDTTAKPMKWRVTFDPTKRGSAATSTVNVDMNTGAATLATTN